MDSLVIMVLIKILRKFKELKESNHMNSSDVCSRWYMCGIVIHLRCLAAPRAPPVRQGGSGYEQAGCTPRYCPKMEVQQEEA